MSPFAAIGKRFLREWKFPVALLTAAVLLAGNVHCEMGGMTVLKETVEHSCCESSDASSPVSEFAPCCAPLIAPIPAVAAAPVALLQEILTAWAVQDFLIPTSMEVRDLPIADSGPPDSDRPPILVDLQKARPAHGPPFVV